jgi:PKD repeat protein
MNKKMIYAEILLAMFTSAALASGTIYQNLLVYAYAGTCVYIDPPLVERYTNTTSVGSEFTVTLWAANFTDLYGYEYKIHWNTTVLNVTKIKDYLIYSNYFIGKNETDYANGIMWFVITCIPPGTSFTGTTKLREITFKIISSPPPGAGNYLYSKIDVYDTVFGDSGANAIEHEVYDGEFYYRRPSLAPPVANFTYSPLLIKVNATVTFNASASYDVDGTIVSYTWNFGDGNVTTVGTPIITHIYTAEGLYMVNLTVTDNDNLSGSYSQQIRVWPEHIPPFVEFTYSPSRPQPNATVTFNASASYDVDGTIVSYTWNFGDGNVTTVGTPIITHIYTAEGNYTVSLTVLDNSGLSNSTSQLLEVLPEIGWLEIQPSARLVLSEEFELNVTIKHLSEKWRLFGIEFRIHFDPTLLEFVGAEAGPFLDTFNWVQTPPYTFLATRLYPDYAIVAITLLDGGPEPPGYVYPHGEGVVVTLKFKTTADVEMHKSYPLDFSITDVVFGNVYAEEIPHYDPKGARYYLRIDPPVPMFIYKPLRPVIGEAITFNASASYDTSPFDNGTIVSYEWDFGDGSVGTGVVCTHAYAEPGEYTVTLMVKDNDGNLRSVSQVVSVSRWYLSVDVNVGKLHFRGEIVQVYITTSVYGSLVDVDSVDVKLYCGDVALDLSPYVVRVAQGVYTLTYELPADAQFGTWLLVAEAKYLSLNGVGSDSFQISPTLTGWNAWILEVKGDVATVKTDVGIIRLNLTSLNASVVSVKGDVATVKTDIGVLTGSVSDLAGKVEGLEELMKQKFPADTGSISTILYVVLAISLIAVILLLYIVFKKKSP